MVTSSCAPFDVVFVLHLQHEELVSATTDLNANLTHTKKALELVLCIYTCICVCHSVCP